MPTFPRKIPVNYFSDRLNELLDERENLDVEEDQDHTPINLVIFPIETANEDHTDGDSGDEELVDMNNLPGSQLRAPVEIIDSNETNENSDSDTDPDEDVPLSVLYGKSKYVSNRRLDKRESVTLAKSFVWTDNSAPNSFRDFVGLIEPPNNASPPSNFCLTKMFILWA
ncbi:hypothetical protein QE152_g19050 [Popillia japonica]|uniref:PiggyBac transposable element-derived protein domain-containing protein n=1 Tax=Popillia japonica TaxID=7064 RepID=A0AAW1L3C3_POPJA